MSCETDLLLSQEEAVAAPCAIQDVSASEQSRVASVVVEESHVVESSSSIKSTRTESIVVSKAQAKASGSGSIDEMEGARSMTTASRTHANGHSGHSTAAPDAFVPPVCSAPVKPRAAAAPPAKQVGIKATPFPTEGPGNRSFSNKLALIAIFLLPAFLVHRIGLPYWTLLVLWPVLAFPIWGLLLLSHSYITQLSSSVSEDNGRPLPGKPLSHYLRFNDENLKKTYASDSSKIPMETFFEAFFDGKIDLAPGMDILEMFERRHDWAVFRLTISQVKFFITEWLPETFFGHSRPSDANMVRDHYDRGDDFYAAFLGTSMVYTFGVVAEPERVETLEELQNNKLQLVCEKMQMQPGERHLDIGCGWGTLTCHAAKYHGTNSTGVTLGRNQADFCRERAKEWGVKDSAKFICADYRDTPNDVQFDKITCLEMAEHVGVRNFQAFLRQVYEQLADDGLFCMQVAGLRAGWQYEDLIWGLFMARYIFPGADASTPLWWYTFQLEQAGFEVRSMDNIGVHYSATIWRWHQNWQKHRPQMAEKYGERLCRIWDVFLAWSTIVPRQGGASCYQIIAYKNRNGFDRSSLLSRRLVA